jgi:hypothetical protein
LAVWAVRALMFARHGAWRMARVQGRVVGHKFSTEQTEE